MKSIDLISIVFIKKLTESPVSSHVVKILMEIKMISSKFFVFTRYLEFSQWLYKSGPIFQYIFYAVHFY